MFDLVYIYILTFSYGKTYRLHGTATQRGRGHGRGHSRGRVVSSTAPVTLHADLLIIQILDSFKTLQLTTMMSTTSFISNYKLIVQCDSNISAIITNQLGKDDFFLKQ